ncbi:MAG TPA: NAD(P)-dependent oxidoreductase [Povalibacter sp.]|nr:NAD(P)-dependent oxidoreductase [Povalibacter sp.]
MRREAFPYRIFLAGAAGAIGRRLVPQLVQAGWTVFGTTRSPEKARELLGAGAEALVVDVFDAGAIEQAIVRTQPSVVLHQLTDLPRRLDPAKAAEALGRNARIRSEGTANLVRAALAARVPRMIAQSIAWAYAPGPQPHREDHPLDLDAQGTRAVSVRGVVELERHVLQSPPLEGIVLRYGRLYGPGTALDEPLELAMPLHVDAAARAAVLAIEHGKPGIYNIAEPGPQLDTDKARNELRWSADWRLQDPQ